MPISIFLFMLLVFWIVVTMQMGALMWAAAKVVRLKNLSIRRAIVWGVVASVVHDAVWVVSGFASPDVVIIIEGLFGLALLVTFVLLFRRVGECSKGRAVGAVAVLFVLSGVVGFPQLFLVQATIVRPFSQTNEAMAPTLLDDDRFLVDLNMRAQRFDLIVFHPPHEDSTVYVSRLIGLPGERVEIIDGRVHIDGTAISPPAGVPDIAYTSDFANWPSVVGVEGAPITLGDDEYFVLGDNTSNSYDSRLWEASNARQAGALPEASIVGVVRMIYSPLSRARLFR